MVSYAIVPPLAWLLAGGSKFVINSAIQRRAAWREIGLGGIPSTHCAVATSPAWLIGLSSGPGSPMFTVAVALAIIVAIDATDTRRRIGDINAVLRDALPENEGARRLRARTGHSLVEVAAGVAVGGIAAAIGLFGEAALAGR